MRGKPLLIIRDLNAYYVVNGVRYKVLRDVNLEIYEGEKVVIVGESGSGKSTLASLILRLEPENLFVTSGSILYNINGKFVDLLKADKYTLSSIRGKEISMIFQNPSTSLNPVYTVGYQVSEALMMEGIKGRRLRNRVISLLKAVRIPLPERRLRNYPHQLSGGQKQRVMIAIAIARNPKLIIADEPTSALDVSVQAEILDLLNEINKKGTTIVMITHDVGIAYDFADRVIVMYGGTIVEVGRAKEVIESPYHPYTKHLVNSIPRNIMVNDLEVVNGHNYVNTIPEKGCVYYLRCPLAIKGLCNVRKPDSILINGRLVKCHRFKGV